VLKALIAAAAALALLLTPARSTTTTLDLSNGPSLTALKSDIAKSVVSTKTPNLNTSIPPIVSLTGSNTPILEAHFPWECQPSSGSATIPPNASTACAFGDTTSKTLVLLTGDSQSSIWLAALNVAGRDLHFKIVYLDEPGCAPWGNPNPPSFFIYGSITVATCNVWRHSIERYAKTLKPKFVILDGKAYPIGKNEDVEANATDFDARLLASVHAFRATGAKVLILSPLPTYNRFRVGPGYTPSNCLVSVTPITKCEYPSTKLIDPVALKGEESVAHKHLADLVTITSLMCTTKRCALFVKASDGSHLVYFDSWHLNTYYSTWIGRAFTSLIKPAL
jgi:hypothetical protein